MSGTVSDNISKSSGLIKAAGGGKIGQVVSTQITDIESATSTSFVTIATPQVTITPSASSSTIHISVSVSYSVEENSFLQFQLFRDTTQIAMGDAFGSRSRIIFGVRTSNASARNAFPTTFQWIDSPGDTSAHTYSLKWKASDGVLYLGRSHDSSDNTSYGSTPNQFIAMEILA